ncbi:MAG: 50S ribosomal protein L1 [Candidatus Aenigmatarchaeota archaeon]|nr:MAG: 50S ribosomal protein L1 [Candidatus Aenigmarchaeota archaeon]
MSIKEKIKEAKENSKPRKFAQTWDLIFNLRELDLKKPENRLNLELFLPEGLGRELKTLGIGDSLFSDAKKHADLAITKDEIPKLAKDKKKLKKLASEYDWWFGEAPLMPMIGKELGVVLGARGKMPKPVPPKINLEGLLKRAKSSVKIRLLNAPVIQIAVGNESMPEDKVIRNIEAAINFVEENLPKGKNNLRNVSLKLTMGKPVKLEVR